MLMPEQLQLAREVHRQVYDIFSYQTDRKTHGAAEHWPDVQFLKEAIAKRQLIGDCDDFALACRHLLWEKDIPNRLVLCRAQGEGHLCTEVSGWILDNNFSRLMTRDELQHAHGYEWISMSGFKPGEPWTAIKK